MKEGDIVELIHGGAIKAVKGSIAIVVDGQDMFPELWRQLVEQLGDEWEAKASFVAVAWVRDPLGQTVMARDGFYAKDRFQLAPDKKGLA